MLFKAEYTLPASPSAYIQDRSGVNVFTLNVFRKTMTLRPGVQQTLKPSCIIIKTIMPRSVCPRVWPIPETERQEWVLRSPGTERIRHIKANRRGVCFGEFVLLLWEANVGDYSPVETFDWTPGKQLHSNSSQEKSRCVTGTDGGRSTLQYMGCWVCAWYLESL